MSKGSHRRPTDEKKFAENFDAIFRKKPEPKTLTRDSLEQVLAETRRYVSDQGEVIIIKPTKAFFLGEPK